MSGSITKWDVNIDRLISLLSDRMYTNQALAGIRELIANSIDAKWEDRPVNIKMYLTDVSDKYRIQYTDDGRGIQDFGNTYGVIGSGAKDEDAGSIGMFGIGRLSLISKLIGNGVVVSKTSTTSNSYSVNRKGWRSLYESPTIVKDLEHGLGFYLDFEVDLVIDSSKMMEDISRIFSIPMSQGKCEITINSQRQSSLITNNYTFITSKEGFGIHYIEREDGRIHYCHNGIEVRSEDFTGLEVWIDESHLDIKTDREGYVNNYPYQRFLRSVRIAVRNLRPKRTLRKLEVDFIDGVMKRFRSFMKRAESVPLVVIPQELPIFSSFDSNNAADSDHQLPNYASDTGIEPTEVMVEEPLVGETPTGGVDLPVSVSTPEMAERLSQITGSTIEEAPDTPELENSSNVAVLGPNCNTETSKPPKPKPIRVRGTRAVDLKTGYPMVFFEQEPFTFIFNTTHPVLKEMIEAEELDRRALGVIFERMLECFYLKDEESLADAKERWTGVDNSLQDFL